MTATFMESLAWALFIGLIMTVLYAILRAGAMAQEHNDKIRRDEYNKRNTLKGGEQ